MATSKEYIEYVCEQIAGVGEITYKKMFGEYMVYVNAKPILTVCDNIVFVKMLDCLKDVLSDADTGNPYQGAKLHYILNIEDSQLSKEVVSILEPITSIPKPRKKKSE